MINLIRNMSLEPSNNSVNSISSFNQPLNSLLLSQQLQNSLNPGLINSIPKENKNIYNYNQAFNLGINNQNNNLANIDNILNQINADSLYLNKNLNNNFEQQILYNLNPNSNNLINNDNKTNNNLLNEYLILNKILNQQLSNQEALLKLLLILFILFIFFTLFI